MQNLQDNIEALHNICIQRQKLKPDICYVDNISFFLDCKILFLTFSKVLKRSGISQTGQATMEEFMGSPK